MVPLNSGQSQALSLRRAAELCLQQGYQYFKIEDSDLTLNKSTYRTPTHVDTHSNYNTNSFRSGSISGQSHSTISGGDLIVVERPVSSFLVKMYKKPIHSSLQASTILSNFTKPKGEEKKKETFCSWVMKVSNDSI